jgi:simple sugar transport system permease protein
MAIATYTGFSITMLFSLKRLVLPFRDPRITWPLGRGAGLRQTVQLDRFEANHSLDKLWSFSIFGVVIPTGMLLVFFVCCVFIWLFMRSKTGLAISAGGSNPMFATAAGIDVDRSRVLANVVSTILGAIGILVYAQSFGFTQLYDGPLMMAFPAIAAVLIGGATVRRARIIHVILGAFIFQGLMASSLPVANEFFKGTDLSETLRMVIQNGIILYALMQAGGANKK